MEYFQNSLSTLPTLKGGKSRSINLENKKGEKGARGKAASHLGVSRKGSPCVPLLKSGKKVVLAGFDGPAVIQHMWFTVTDRRIFRLAF
ncbi:MAG: hypothetical protein ACK5LT_00270 [Lachnospirales bacterium]